MTSITIKRASLAELEIVAALAGQLWPHHTGRELEAEFAPLLESKEAAVLLALDGERPLGFAQCQLRRDYVEGTATSPVGYLEGIFVTEEYRCQGIAKALLGACEDWTRMQGCREFASDCELDNLDSLRFHMALGFAEANRIICFAKML